MSPETSCQVSCARRVGVVVGQGVAGAAAHRRGPERHLAAPPLGVVAFDDGRLLQVGGPLVVAIEVDEGLPHPLRRGRDRPPLGRLFGHRAAILTRATARGANGLLAASPAGEAGNGRTGRPTARQARARTSGPGPRRPPACRCGRCRRRAATTTWTVRAPSSGRSRPAGAPREEVDAGEADLLGAAAADGDGEGPQERDAPDHEHGDGDRRRCRRPARPGRRCRPPRPRRRRRCPPGRR